MEDEVNVGNVHVHVKTFPFIFYMYNMYYRMR